MAAALAATQGAKAGQQAWQAISSALAADLVVIRTQTTRGRGKRKQPVDLEFHVNPLGLGAAAVGAGLTLWLMQLRAAPTATEVYYGKYVWPSDGTDATKVMELVKLGTPPTRQIGSVDVWKLYTGGFPSPYTVVAPNTPGAVPTTVPIMETANYEQTETKTETRIAIKQRVGFLGNGAGTESEHDAWYYATTPGWKIIRDGIFGW